MKSSVKQPRTITDCRTSEINGRTYLLLRIVGQKRFLFGTERGDLTFSCEGYKLVTTHGKGATRLDSIKHMIMVESDGQFELQAEMKPNSDSGTNATLRRIATTESRDAAETIWRTWGESDCPLRHGKKR
mgnify:FL=1